MLTNCSVEEKREFLRLSRIRLDIDAKHPREKATDAIVERGIYGCSVDGPCTEEDINKVIASTGLMNGLRRNELKTSLDRLCQDQKVLYVGDGKYTLSRDQIVNIESDIKEANRRFDKIVDQVYKPIIEKRNKPIYAKFFLELISVIFARFGDQWIKSLSSQASPKDFLKGSDVEAIFKSLARTHGLPKAQLEGIKKLSLKFFIENDPDYSYLKFNLAQSIYITKILGIDTPIDLFSQEIFSNAHIILDTNLVFASLLPVSKYNTTFKELLRICKKVKIELSVTEATKEEVERVVHYFEKEAVNLFDEIPERIVPKVRGIFFESYIEEKKKNPAFSVADLFKPFHDLKETLHSAHQINIIDSQEFDELAVSAEKEIKLQNIFNATSHEVRKRGKTKESILHDIFHYFLIERERKAGRPKSWFLTLDTSLPYVAIKLQKDNESPFCFNLDVMMQCFSPFITTDQEVYDFSDVFAKLIANQLFPSSKIFDVRDFVFFNDIGIKLNEMSEDDIEEALIHIKGHVLRGKVYSHADFDKVAYEVKRLFAGRAEKDGAIRKYLERISEMESKHSLELSTKDDEIKQLKKEKEEREDGERKKKADEDKKKANANKAKDIAIKFTCFIVTAISCLYMVIYIAILFAEGKNIFQKIINFWEYFAVWGGVFVLYFKGTVKKTLSARLPPNGEIT